MQHDLRRLLDAATIAVPEAVWVGIRKRSTTASWHVARDGAFDQSSSGYDEGVMVEVLYAGQFGYAATPDLSPLGVAAAAKMALISAKSAVGRGVHDFDVSVRPGTKAGFVSPRTRKSAIASNEIGRASWRERV